ncbi:MAG: glyoxalase [Rhodobacteraceae bacterium]|nr:glyoxalase [Paracoccaceae bacterium]
MDLDKVGGAEFGASLHGMGLNLLVKDVQRSVDILKTLFGMTAYQPTQDFAIMRYGDQLFQLHVDGAFGAHPLLGLLPEAGARGAGIELRLYESDPDEASQKAEAAGCHILQAPADKLHGLRECVILDPDGYAWVPSRRL